jgi:hypothetical protein
MLTTVILAYNMHFFCLTALYSSHVIMDGGLVMEKYIITITPVLKNKPLPAIVLDVSNKRISVNYPKSADIEVGHSDVHPHSELCVKMPHDDNELHLWFNEIGSETEKQIKAYENQEN